MLIFHINKAIWKREKTSKLPCFFKEAFSRHHRYFHHLLFPRHSSEKSISPPTTTDRVKEVSLPRRLSVNQPVGFLSDGGGGRKGLRSFKGGIERFLCPGRKHGPITSSEILVYEKPGNGADSGLENVHPARSSLGVGQSPWQAAVGDQEEQWSCINHPDQAAHCWSPCTSPTTAFPLLPASPPPPQPSPPHALLLGRQRTFSLCFLSLHSSHHLRPRPPWPRFLGPSLRQGWWPLTQSHF